MDICEIQKVVQDAYEININFIEKIKNVYKIYTEGKQYCLKVIKYDFGHFLFIISAIKHLQKNNFKYIPEIIQTKQGSDYTEIYGRYAYLTEWIEARQCNYNNPVDTLIAASKLAELHKKSEKFVVEKNMNPRIGWLKWIKTFKTRSDEILDFKHRIYKKGKKTEFDSLYIKIMDNELQRSQRSIKNLSESKYIEIMKHEIMKKGFCHHDYANHNILINAKGNVNIIDFDYCILDTHLHDLASLLIRCMKHGKWNINAALFILEAYNVVNAVKQDDIPIMAAFMEFPQAYWQVGIQYYWENQPWGEQVFLKKLKRICDDNDQKEKFIKEFRYLKYN